MEPTYFLELSNLYLNYRTPSKDVERRRYRSFFVILSLVTSKVWPMIDSETDGTMVEPNPCYGPFIS